MGAGYAQIERLGRPLVKTIFESFEGHNRSNRSAPAGDPALADAVESFTATAAGRSAQTAAALKALLTPDELLADLSQRGVKASYLGVETRGATGSRFGGRAPIDDVSDITLGAVFGNALAAWRLAPDDGHATPCLTTDNVGPERHHVGVTFPYLGAPSERRGGPTKRHRSHTPVPRWAHPSPSTGSG